MSRTGLTAAEAAAATLEYGSVKAAAGQVYWLDFEPRTGCNRLHGYDLLRQTLSCLTPEGMSVRSRVHEYGGGAWTLIRRRRAGACRSEPASAHDGIAWVNDQDQQIWLTLPDPTSAAVQQPRISSMNPTDEADRSRLPLTAANSYCLTSQANLRFADLTYDPVRHRLLAVAETHAEGFDAEGDEAEGNEEEGNEEEDKAICNLLVAICLDSGELTRLAEGADFYASPALSPDGRWLAWVEWYHPAQPWLHTRICLSDLEHPEQGASCVTPPEQPVSWLQPRFSDDGELLAVGDPDDWWNLFSLSADAPPQPLAETVPAEFTQPPWQLGLCSYGWSAQGELLAITQAEGVSRLQRYQAALGCWQTLTLPFTRLHSLALAGDHAFMVAEAPDRAPGVIQLHLASQHWRYLCGGAAPAYTPALPHHHLCPLESGEGVPFFYYPPQRDGLLLTDVSMDVSTNVSTDVATDAPPLIMLMHGGPTSSSLPVLNPRIQYWTQRGFAVADLNYRGSCGYGRRYRLLLEQRWGIADVEDAESVADWLVSQNLADAKALFIRGQSAGGYTVLMALLRSRRWCAGASLYGISDLQRLAQTTHKFESRYLNWLIGDPADQELYRQRSPYYLADGWQTPVIFFQGRRDRVVPPEQTLSLQTRLQQAGVKVEACLFDEEAHGFRLARNQQRVLERELAFYLECLSAATTSTTSGAAAPADTKVLIPID